MWKGWDDRSAFIVYLVEFGGHVAPSSGHCLSLHTSDTRFIFADLTEISRKHEQLMPTNPHVVYLANQKYMVKLNFAESA